MRKLVTREGESTFKSERMEFADPPTMAPCVIIAHHINAHSPLYGKSAKDLAREAGAVIVSVR